MNKRPAIAVTPSYNKDGYIRMNPAYFTSIWKAGGLPSFVAYTDDPAVLDEYVASYDGFLFAGGVDVDPKYYGETVAFDSVEINPVRDSFELALFKKVYASGKPILGICRGIQLLNVALGGSLYQHIEGHSQSAGRGVRTQKTTILPGNRLSDILGGRSELDVNSFHHQAVKTLAPGLVAAAYSADGICEGVSLPDYRYFIGVQWHPELLEGDDSAALFKSFVESCK